jgi:catechol 2,3-dioxygenase-like lactoylglutathione lyase family enzyme
MNASLALHPGRLFHVGIVTNDFDATLAELTATLGFAWKGGQARVMDLWLYGEPRQVEMRIAHSVQGPPHYEVIASVPDTPWDPAKAGVHHLCYWSDRSNEVCAALEAAGYRRVLGQAGSEAGYFISPDGRLTEIIGPTLHGQLSGWIASAGRAERGSS